jgi:hypothetical protein
MDQIPAGDAEPATITDIGEFLLPALPLEFASESAGQGFADIPLNEFDVKIVEYVAAAEHV